MSIIYNNQVVAGKYTQQIVADADTVNAGIIKIATEEQINEGTDNTTAVTPFYLAQKQDKVYAGDGIVIDNNEISCTINPDEQTIVRKNNGTMQCIGQLTKSNTLKFDWEGTQAEYNVAYLNGTIQPDWYCYITDDESIVDYGDVANQSLSNLKQEGEDRFNIKADKATTLEGYGITDGLNKNQITNCLLEVPQNIKLELADGVLTLKAGSTYILPNGKDNFEHITISEDLTRNKFGNGSHENLYIQMYVPNSTGIGGLSFVEPRNITVGTEQPASGMWYNTTTNQIINYISSGAEDAIRSFPIAVVKTESGIVTEIKEVLNGIGHFGSVIFADKGIKCLIPNGRNEDGTLNNIEFKTDEVLVHNITENKTGWGLYLASSHLTKSTVINYDDLSNYNIHPTLGNYLYCQIGTFDTSSTNFAVSNFRVKEPFRAVDWNDFKKLHVNTPYFFGMYQWFERDPENVSWLKSNGQWNSGTGYQDFYNWALAKANADTSGFALSTASYTDYDFVINTSAKTFRLPIKVQNAPNGETAPVIGNGISLGLTDGINYYGLGSQNVSSHPAKADLQANTIGQPVGYTGGARTVVTGVVGVVSNPATSGLIADLSLATNSNLSLYFYVGETVRDEFLINVGEIASNIADKVDAQQASGTGMPSSKYINLTLGASGTTYTAPANGFVDFIRTCATVNEFVAMVTISENGVELLHTKSTAGSAGNTANIYAPVKKGDSFKIVYTATGTTINSFRFVYAQGEV